jgi:hypothetical protein
MPVSIMYSGFYEQLKFELGGADHRSRLLLTRDSGIRGQRGWSLLRFAGARTVVIQAAPLHLILSKSPSGQLLSK